ncbi:hypothetical protein ACQ0MK_11470 [Thalassospira lucentensis]|uniref:hypothetical protein n=1 Tax=Thalassospira lucentensis TaxID=168935 RepID=UPI003D2F40B8
MSEMKNRDAETGSNHDQVKTILEADIRSFVLENLPYDRAKTATVAELKAKSAEELLLYYMNWLQRLVPNLPRRAHLSSSLLLNPLFLEYKDAFAKIRNLIETGASLQSYLSHRVELGYVRDKKLKNRQHLDLLFSECGIHHLHLDKKPNPERKGLGSDHLLFCIFRQNDAYLIDILPHNQDGLWADSSLFRTIVENWPNHNLLVRSPSVQEELREHNATEHLIQRNKGANSSICIDGQAFFGTGMMSHAGLSQHLTLMYKKLVWPELFKFYYRWQTDREQLCTELLAQGAYLSSSSNPRFHIDPDGRFGVFEHSQKAFMCLGKLALLLN